MLLVGRGVIFLPELHPCSDASLSSMAYIKGNSPSSEWIFTSVRSGTDINARGHWCPLLGGGWETGTYKRFSTITYGVL